MSAAQSATPRTDAARTIANAGERAATFELIAMQCERETVAQAATIARLRAALETIARGHTNCAANAIARDALKVQP